MHIKALGCGLLAAFLVTTHAAHAQDAKATEIIGKARAAIGGDRLNALKTLTLTAATERNVGQMQMAGEIELALEMPDKYVKSETSRGMMAMTMSSGFNGEKAILPANVSMAPGGAMMFRIGPGGPAPGEAPKLTDEQKAEINAGSLRNARVEISRLMLGWFATAHPTLQPTYTYVGEAESPDGKAHVIDVRNADGFEARLFIDQNNSLPLMVTYKGRMPRMMTSTMARPARGEGQGAPPTEEERARQRHETEERIKREAAEAPLVEFSMFFDDWRDVDGIRFPHLMRRASGGETTEEWTVSKVKVNPKVDAKKFAVEAR